MKTILSSLALIAFLSTVVCAQDYKIQLNRPMKAGESYKTHVTATQSESMKVTSNGAPLKDNKDEFSVDYQSVERIVAVDDLGRETKASSTIEKFTKTTAGATTELLPKGTVVVTSVSGKKQTHEVDGKPVAADVAKALDLAISLSKGGPTDDQAFGTNDPKKIGDSWDANTAAMQQTFGDSFEGKVENLTGKGKLVDVAKDATGDVLKLNVHITGKVIPPLPPAFTVDGATLEADFGGDFPVNPALGRPKDTISMSFSFSAHADAPTGEKVVLEAVVNTTAVHSQTRL